MNDAGEIESFTVDQPKTFKSKCLCILRIRDFFQPNRISKFESETP